VSWRYLVGVLEIFDRFAGDICTVLWRFLIDVLEIVDGCPVDI